MDSNALLAGLSANDADALRPYLKRIPLQARTVLFNAGEQPASVYFPLQGMISLVTTLSTGEMIEAAMIGWDGVAGASSALVSGISPNLAIVQLSGSAMVCDAADLRIVVKERPTMLAHFFRFENLVYVQAQQSAACMAVHDIEARLCRWLLRARELAKSDELDFTQEFLAEMLGVRRSSVSPVAHALQKAGLISYKRGRIAIEDAERLKQSACECYDSVRAQHQVILNGAFERV
jgi:CRP-like cAMP-binding protein